MDDSGNIPWTNDESWYTKVITLEISRISLLAIVGNIELALRHPDIPKATKEETRKLGLSLAMGLIEDGIILPDDVMEAWYKTFGITPAIQTWEGDIQGT